jgi:hypothetical protein
MTIAADSAFSAYVNGNYVGAGGGPQSPRAFALALQAGATNVIAIDVDNDDGGAGGLLVDVR